MKKETGLIKPKNMGSFIELFKNVKFIVVNVLILTALVLALISGEGRNIAVKFYEKTTGQRYESFSPVEDRSMTTYLILKDKLRRDLDLDIEDVEVALFKVSADHHKYRVAVNSVVSFYDVEKGEGGIWHIRNLNR